MSKKHPDSRCKISPRTKADAGGQSRNLYDNYVMENFWLIFDENFRNSFRNIDTNF